MIRDGVPDGVEINSIVLMAEPVPDAPNITPWKPRAQIICLITQPDRRLADPLQIAFHGVNGFSVIPELLKTHAGDVQLNPVNALKNVPERLAGCSKRQAPPLDQSSPAPVPSASPHHTGQRL